MIPQINVEREVHLTSLELFAGAGGVALGTHLAGFKHIALVEWDNFAVQTLKENSKELLELDPQHILHCDARAVNYKEYAHKVDLLTAGPPCQPFSNAGKNLGPDDPRNMFPVLFDAIAQILPKAILVENVKGLQRGRFQDYYSYILKSIEFPLLQIREGETWQEHYTRLKLVDENDFAKEEQYAVTYQLVDTADFGIPQRRERVIIYGYRKDLGLTPRKLMPTHSKKALLIDQWITGEYWKRHKLSSYDNLGPMDKKLLERLRQQELFEPEHMPWKTVRAAISDLPEPVARGEKETIPNHVQHPGARIYDGHIGSFWDYPSKALKAGTHGTPGGENILRVTPDGSMVRYFTTREAARLQTFPDEWQFLGTWGACIKQLGNAVPVELARQFAQEIRCGLLTAMPIKV